METIICKNCDTQIDGSYCPNCSQSKKANSRLTFKSIISDFFETIFNFDKGFFYTIWNLILHPGFVVNSFIDGKRKRFTNPVKFFIIAKAIQALFDYFFMKKEHGIPFTNFSFISNEMNQSMRLWNQILLLEYPISFGFIQILIWPIPLYFLFKRSKYNLAELITGIMYFLSTVVILIMIISMIHNPITKTNLSMELVMIIGVFYMVYALIRFYETVSLVSRLIRIIIAFLILFTFRVFIIPYSLSWFFPLS